MTTYLRHLAMTDVISVALAVSLAQFIRFGSENAIILWSRSPYSYTIVTTTLIIAWIALLSIYRCRDARIVGSGLDEYKRVVQASLTLFGTVAIVAFLLKLEVARGYLGVALPLGLTALMLSRWGWRKWLARQRSVGRCLSTVLVVGAHRAAIDMAKVFEREPGAGYRVVGVCVPGWTSSQRRLIDIDGHRVPVLGDEHSVLEVLAETGASTVAISNPEFLGVDGMRGLAWQLEASNTDMVVCPGVVDVAGPRLHISPVAGLPLLHVDKPAYRGARKVGKLVLDLSVATVAAVLGSPLLIVLALVVKFSSPGPVFYRSERIGLNGQPFVMLKFRSMVVDADAQRSDLLELNQGSGPLFKLRSDPRVTRAGRWMRRLSLDELPQLFNVLQGQMSVVGPRPPLRAEVEAYTGDIHRRLMVKPGITGLWQVSGRSNLSWEESVRLDLYYVENWSMIQDLLIALRTVKAVLRSSGAY